MQLFDHMTNLFSGKGNHCSYFVVLQVQEFGVCEVRDLKPNGANILVTEENKKEYVHLVCQMKMTGEFVSISSFTCKPIGCAHANCINYWLDECFLFDCSEVWQ